MESEAKYGAILDEADNKDELGSICRGAWMKLYTEAANKIIGMEPWMMMTLIMTTSAQKRGRSDNIHEIASLHEHPSIAKIVSLKIPCVQW